MTEKKSFIKEENNNFENKLLTYEEYCNIDSYRCFHNYNDASYFYLSTNNEERNVIIRFNSILDSIEDIKKYANIELDLLNYKYNIDTNISYYKDETIFVYQIEFNTNLKKIIEILDDHGYKYENENFIRYDHDKTYYKTFLSHYIKNKNID